MASLIGSTQPPVRDHPSIGEQMHRLAQRLWPLNRSISGAGLRQTLTVLQEILPDLRLMEVASGSKVLDWTVPDEWEMTEGWLEGPDGSRILDSAHNNLHVVGYSTAVDQTFTLDELQPFLHSLPDQPDAIPYVTSYYKRTWGFCLSHRQRQALEPGLYRAHIEARHFPGSITLAELVLPGEQQTEVFFSTYCCHPSMANNELSGPCLATFLASWLQGKTRRKHTYRFVFLPEMIGSVAYLQGHMDVLKAHTIAGFNLSCVGDERTWSFLPSRHGHTLADKVAQHALQHAVDHWDQYSWRDRASDESNYCAPGIDLPVASVMRSKYGTFPEYHTSLDDLEHVVTAAGLQGSFDLYRKIIDILEHHCYPRSTVLGEPQLGPRGLYPSLSIKGSSRPVRSLLDLMSMADGSRSLLDIATFFSLPVWDFFEPLQTLIEHNLLEISELPFEP
jgi:aminopeptidase-like protein